MDPITPIRRLQTTDDRDRIGAGLLRSAVAAERRANKFILLDVEGQGAVDAALECCFQNRKNLPPSSIAGGLHRLLRMALGFKR